MGCQGSKLDHDAKEAEARSAEIEAQLQRDQMLLKYVFLCSLSDISRN
jgi:hypothetical protein